MKLDISIINLIITVIGILGTIIGAISYAKYRVKSGSDQAESDTVKTLNDLNDAQQKKITLLTTSVADLTTQVTNMQNQIDDLMKRRTYTDSLLKEALLEYFAKHKDIARSVDKMSAPHKPVKA